MQVFLPIHQQEENRFATQNKTNRKKKDQMEAIILFDLLLFLIVSTPLKTQILQQTPTD